MAPSKDKSNCQGEAVNEHNEQHEKKPHEIVIHIDRNQFKVEKPTLTGEQLRQLPSPPIGADYDLFREVPGGEDKLIADQENVELENGMHFFSVQRNINPGV
jgi:hypothetical protein